jgi:hypothetical protein
LPPYSHLFHFIVLVTLSNVDCFCRLYFEKFTGLLRSPIGLPTLAALEQGIPVIAVRENHNRMKNDLEKLPFAEGKLFVVENYLEAVGIMTALKAGVAPSSVRRPITHTKVVCAEADTKSRERSKAQR